MTYDDDIKKWINSGTSTGLSKVNIYHHQTQNTFRVVGRKLHDHEVGFLKIGLFFINQKQIQNQRKLPKEKDINIENLKNNKKTNRIGRNKAK